MGNFPFEPDAGRISRRQLLQGIAVAATAAALPLPLEAAGFKGTWVNQYTYVAPDLSKTVEWYIEVFGMQKGHADAKQVHLWYGDTGGDTMMVVRQAEAGEKAPRIEKFGFTIGDWNRGAVEAELRRLGGRPRADTDNGVLVRRFGRERNRSVRHRLRHEAGRVFGGADAMEGGQRQPHRHPDRGL